MVQKVQWFIWYNSSEGTMAQNFIQGIDGSAPKPVLVQDSDCMVEKTNHSAPYVDLFGAYLLPQ